MQKAGFNFHGYNIANTAKALDWVRHNKPNSVVVLDNESFASQCADAGVPYPILRVTTNDNDVHLKVGSFNEWWKAVKAKYTDKRLIVHFNNEPHSNYPRLNQFMTDGINQLHSEGYRGVWGNFSVGTPETSDWSVFYSTLQLLLKYKGEQFLGMHEYFMGILPYAIPYYVSRYRNVPLNVDIILTEFETDYIQQIYTSQHLPNIRGFRDHLNYYKSIGANDPEAAMMSQFKSAFDQFYNADQQIKGVNFFCYGNSGGWDTYNFEGSDLIDSFNIFEVGNVVPTNPNSKVINTKAGLNLRVNPSKNSTVITTMPYGSTHTVFADPVITADGYNWQAVDSGWAANFVDNAPSWIDPIPATAWTKQLKVIYYSQTDANANLKQNDCGYASDRMLMSYDFLASGLLDPMLISVNDLVRKSPLMNSDSGQTLSEVLSILTGYGVKALTVTGLIADNIRAEIDANRPVLVLVNYKHVNPAQTSDMGHYMVIIGYNTTSFLFHDPYLLGANQTITQANLDLAMSDVLGATNIASVPYQGICLTSS